ncbi:MAG: hypothetical protein KAQ90_09640 [Melioribacteraceae bacterium]|nr:hypothetical protein [Melioribacteraceae bacterium]
MKKVSPKQLLKFIGSFGLILFLIFAFHSCNSTELGTEPETISMQQQSTILSKANPEIQKVMSVQERHTKEIMENKDVVGTAVGLTEDGKLTILVLTKNYVSMNALAKSSNPVPQNVDGHPVTILYTGEIRAMNEKISVKKGKPQKGGGKKPPKVDHKAIQDTPIQLGTSGGWADDLANGYCCGGTLGCLIQIGSTQYILSNYHVFSADIVSGGNGIVAEIGDDIIQPGLIDVGCISSNAQVVATLSSVNVLPGANIDAAIAAVVTGMVDPNGAILEIGTLSNQTVGASIGMKVKKSGRTTGLSSSTISGLNATVSVIYDNECAGGEAFTKTFTGQIIIKNRGSKFLNSGDSGSLMVEKVDSNPRAVGLLFAGSSVTAVANPIDEVLSFFGASMVGN